MKPFTLLALLSGGVVFAADPCRVEIVDKENGWPVPLVELRTTHEARYVSDNAGLIALDDPDLLGREVWFHVKGHGYGVKKDGFGYEGVRVTPKAGETIRVEVERRNVAKRLGRLTGAGLFAEELKLGGKERLPESGVYGCDSVLLARQGGKLFWLWGDTTLPGYPLGVFQSTAALTSGQPVADFKPPLAIPYELFRDEKDKPRGVAPMPGEGPTWLSGMIELPDADGSRHLVATYSKIKGHLDEYEIGLCKWDATKNSFVRHTILWKEGDGEKGVIPRGHPFVWKDDLGKEWVLFGDPFPTMRCPANLGDWGNRERWEKIAEPPAPRSAEDGSEVKPHRGSVAWNASRKRWISVFTQTFGKPSAFGEIWYAEAESPMGPWGKAVKILTHDNYTFYNPRIHPELTPDDAGFIVFEGTYTAEFANHAQPTPRYNYNQMLYRLDLDDPKLAEARE
ncbi:DUF4185 domain-containing protein [Luteolibacter flavescens]|uniref:DUF4185 domain-containing protein n=1 Tax=Luteolibacter flavescens TaxID=1859460 RepID=A0ABT3FIL2_9BACT|nr:DUF4185 domain-containing protein [Luteolibacter flavescens]MCW1883412.1 DUF4185 domain-containing protein [Luteolibacter flavescens]